LRLRPLDFASRFLIKCLRIFKGSTHLCCWRNRSMMFAQINTHNAKWIRPALLAALAIGLLVAPGCKSRRSAYRPVFVDPSPMMIEPAPSTPVGVPLDSEPPLGLPQGFEEGFAPSYSTPVPPPAEEIPNVAPPAQDSEPSFSPIPGRNDQESEVPSTVVPPTSRRDNRPAPPSSAGRTAFFQKFQPRTIGLFRK
jgi:hypothetical protein